MSGDSLLTVMVKRRLSTGQWFKFHFEISYHYWCYVLFVLLFIQATFSFSSIFPNSNIFIGISSSVSFKESKLFYTFINYVDCIILFYINSITIKTRRTSTPRVDDMIIYFTAYVKGKFTLPTCHGTFLLKFTVSSNLKSQFSIYCKSWVTQSPSCIIT